MANDSYDDAFMSAGKQYGIDPQLIKTVFHLESGGNPLSVASDQGAVGGMQMLPATAKSLGVSDPTDMSQAIPAAANYLAQGLKATGTPEGALAYYHAGPNQAGWGPKTAAYVSKGQALYDQVPIRGGQVDQTIDPDVAAGQALLKSLTSPQAAGAGGSTPIDHDPDYARGQAVLASLTSPQAVQAEQGAADPGMMSNIMSGLHQGGRDVATTASQFADWVDKKVPALKALDDAVLAPGEQAQADATRAENTAAYNASPAASSWSGAGGRLVGGAIASAPIGGLVGKVVGPIAGAITGAAGVGAVDAAGRAALTPGVLPAIGRIGSRLVAGSGEGAAQGAVQAGATSSASDEPVGDQIAGGAEVGGLLGAAGVGAKGVLWDAPKAIYNKLTGSGIAEDLEAKLAARVAEKPASDASARSPQADGAAASVDSQSQPAGAQVSPADAPQMTDKQMLDARGRDETNKLRAAAPEGMDATQYVNGSNPTLAETMGDAKTALEQKAISEDHRVAKMYVSARKAADEARDIHARDLMGDDVTKGNLEQARQDNLDVGKPAAFDGKQPTDAAPTVKVISDIKNGAEGKMGPVSDAMDEALGKLYDKDGNLETDPEMLYGARRHIDYMMSKVGALDKPARAAAVSQLQQVKKSLDGVIEDGAPGYRAYMDQYAADSRPIDVQEYLQGKLKQMYGNGSYPTYKGVQAVMDDIVSKRKMSGFNAPKSIDDDTMQGLWNLRDDLRRQRNLDLGTARGSNTNQMGNVASQLGMLGAHALAGQAGPLGNFALSSVKNKIMGDLSNKEINIQAARYLDGMNLPGRAQGNALTGGGGGQ
jgi:hypothetical protein